LDKCIADCQQDAPGVSGRPSDKRRCAKAA
jgi:hypothetical protein